MPTKLIEDVKPRRVYSQAATAAQLNTLIMIRELHQRGVTIREIYGRYYEIEAVGEAHSERLFGNDEEGLHGNGLTLEDAELAGVSETVIDVIKRQPF